MSLQHFISLADTSTERLQHMMSVSRRLKHQLQTTGANDLLLHRKTLAMIFEKPSLRTRVSFSVAMTQLGGTGLLLSKDEVGLGVREPVKDVARVLGGMVDGVMARVFEHQKLLDLARYSTVPVINALSDYSHPCQALADLMTIDEHFGKLAGLTLAYVGDGNNVARSLAVACCKFGLTFNIATPRGYELPADDIATIQKKFPGLKINVSPTPVEAVRNADVCVTDTWVSMGQESEKAKRVAEFKGYALDESLMAHAPSHAIVLHCLPAYRGYEISEGVFESDRSKVFQEAHNRLHIQKGILAVLMGGA
jgi:ornithine carbamoyltransferase